MALSVQWPSAWTLMSCKSSIFQPRTGYRARAGFLRFRSRCRLEQTRADGGRFERHRAARAGHVAVGREIVGEARSPQLPIERSLSGREPPYPIGTGRLPCQGGVRHGLRLDVLELSPRKHCPDGFWISAKPDTNLIGR